MTELQAEQGAPALDVPRTGAKRASLIGTC